MIERLENAFNFCMPVIVPAFVVLSVSAVVVMVLIAWASHEDKQAFKVSSSQSMLVEINSGMMTEETAVVEFRRFWQRRTDGREADASDEVEPLDPDGSGEGQRRRRFKLIDPDRKRIFDGSRGKAIGIALCWIAAGLVALSGAVMVFVATIFHAWKRLTG